MIGVIDIKIVMRMKLVKRAQKPLIHLQSHDLIFRPNDLIGIHSEETQTFSKYSIPSLLETLYG